MDYDNLKRQFGRMGARAQFRWSNTPQRLAIDIREDGLGSYFDIDVHPTDLHLSAQDVQPKQRHLLLVAGSMSGAGASKFLCGHDERAWFVCAVPNTGVTNVAAAMESLKPVLVRTAQDRVGVRPRHRGKRHTDAYIRQGEWFFVPAPDAKVNEWLILRNEPLSRGGGKPHMAEFLSRTGGERLYVSPQFRNGLAEARYRKLISNRPEAAHWNWRVMFANPEVLVKGHVKHPDHKTIVLSGWHRVLPNTEHSAAGNASVRFLD